MAVASFMSQKCRCSWPAVYSAKMEPPQSRRLHAFLPVRHPVKEPQALSQPPGPSQAPPQRPAQMHALNRRSRLNSACRHSRASGPAQAAKPNCWPQRTCFSCAPRSCPAGTPDRAAPLLAPGPSAEGPTRRWTLLEAVGASPMRRRNGRLGLTPAQRLQPAFFVAEGLATFRGRAHLMAVTRVERVLRNCPRRDPFPE